jgi:hypothetical protein
VAPTTNVDDTPLTDLDGYRLYYGLSSGEYTESEDVSQQTTSMLSGLEGGRTYYVSVTAYDSSGNESDYADEASVHVVRGCLQTGNSFLWGRVTAEDVGLPGVTLTLRGPDDCLEMTTTGDLGLYHFSRLALGAYTLTLEAQACSFTPANQDVELTDRLAWLPLRANCP